MSQLSQPRQPLLPKPGSGTAPMIRLVTASLVSLMVCLSLASCQNQGAETEPPETATEAAVEVPQKTVEWALAIHGGAGVISKERTDADGYYESLEAALSLGRNLLAEGVAAVEVVEKVVELLEDDAKFNAGRGAVFTNQGTHELDAAIIDRRTLSCGAVAGVKNVRNPIKLARRVMERSKHVLLAGRGADLYAREVDVRRVQQEHFYTQPRYDAWRQAVRDDRVTGGDGQDLGTVGAVALDRYGNLAAATSTGGMTNKRFGRVGDVPIIGAGTYAKNSTAAISGTGHGEQFIRHTVAHDISALIEYKGLSASEAAGEVIQEKLSQGDGGVIVVGADGTIAMPFNTAGMFRGAANSEGRFDVGIWEDLRAGTPLSTSALEAANGQ